MSNLEHFPWPPTTDAAPTPRWNGRDFVVGSRTERILTYSEAESHWSADLTALHETEAGRNHPIDIASRNLAISSMRRLRATDPVILDVGCSSGFVLADLRASLPQSQLIGADYLPGPLLGLADRMPDIPILQFDLRNCPLPTGCVDGVTCLNVLEHIDNDAAAMHELYRVLKPGGVAHIEVPAGPTLHDIYDEYLMHHRRYRLAALVRMAESAGFTVVKASHLGFLIFPAFYLTKRNNQTKRALSTEQRAVLVARQIRRTRTNPLFGILMSIETALDRFVSYPWGIRCIVVAQKGPR